MIKNRVIVADALRGGIRQLPNRSVNLVVTSPPYADQRRKFYFGMSEENYPEWCCEWMAALSPKLADDASVIINIRSHIVRGCVADYVLKTRLVLRQSGWIEPEELIWIKPDAPPMGSTQRPRRTWEHLLWYSRTRRPYIDLRSEGRQEVSCVRGKRIRQTKTFHSWQMEAFALPPRDTDMIVAPCGGIARNIEHPAMFPLALPLNLIKRFSRPGDVVLDPFCGSGTTLLAAKQLRRRWIGIDRCPRYVAMTRARLKTL